MRLLRLAWRDSWISPLRFILLASGVAVGVAALALCFALAAGMERVVLQRVLGVLPDQIQVEPRAVAMGPIKMQGGPPLDETLVARIQALPGVAGVLRRVRIALPTNLTSQYAGRRIYTDLIVELVDSAIIAEDVPPDKFGLRPPDQPVPAVLPAVLLDVLNVGLSANTGLPSLNERAVIGHHFTLNIGSSSYKWGPTVTLRCEVVGISPRVGVGGPALPLAYLPEIERMLKERGGSMPGNTAAYALTVQLKSPQDAAAVVEAIRAMGLDVPQMERAARVTAAIRGIAAAMSLFGLLVLLVAGAGIANGMALMVKDEAAEIGLFRAVGASYGNVLSLYLLRAAYVGLAGGAAGLVMAVVASLIINHLAAELLPGLLSGKERLAAIGVAGTLGALAFGVAASVLAGFLPARQAARLNPAAALRER